MIDPKIEGGREKGGGESVTEIEIGVEEGRETKMTGEEGMIGGETWIREKRKKGTGKGKE